MRRSCPHQENLNKVLLSTCFLTCAGWGAKFLTHPHDGMEKYCVIYHKQGI